MNSLKAPEITSLCSWKFLAQIAYDGAVIKSEKGGNRMTLLAWDEVLVYKGIPEMPAEMETTHSQVVL